MKSTPSRLAHVLLASIVFAATIMFTAQPAEAASALKACYQVKTGGLYYNNVYTQPGLTTWLFYSSDNANWYLAPVAPRALDQSGCAEWNVSGTGLENYYLRTVVYSTNGQGYVGATYFGWSTFSARPGYGTYAHLGFSYVSCDICPWG